jgi:hypothetical protein
MGRHGSDKGSMAGTAWHNYTPFYHSIWESRQTDALRVFEMGLGTNNTDLPSNMGADGKPGASLRGWAEYFPNSKVFGADIDRDILFQEERIDTYYCDQTSATDIAALWSQGPLAAPFDIIIDDGLHTFSANNTFFENSIYKLAIGGVYVIEDVRAEDIPIFSAKIGEWEQKYNIHASIVPLASAINQYDNTLVVIRRN